MSIEAAGAVSSATTSQAQSGSQPVHSLASNNPTSEISVRPTDSSQVHQPAFLEKASTHVYETIDNLGVKGPEVEDQVSTAINKAKQDLQPASQAISPGKEASKPEGNEALEALSKTFDHAVFMAMVNQIISGVSDTSRTMIKQQ